MTSTRSRTPPTHISLNSPIYSLGPEWPNIDKMVGLDDDDDDNILDSLVPFLERRIATRNTLVSDHKSKRKCHSLRVGEKKP